MENIVIGVDGYSASSRPEKDTLSNVILAEIISITNPRYRYKFTEISSVGPQTIDTICARINSTDFPNTNLLLIGKSMGGAKIYQFYKKYFRMLENFNKVDIFFIDAHAPFLQLGEIFSINIKKHANNIRVYNMYQRNKWPRGAKMKGYYEQNSTKLIDTSVDHWNIVKNIYVTTLIKTLLKNMDS